jgi:hypothetical protein
MKIYLIFLILFLCEKTFSKNDPRLFCHGDGIRSSLFFWDGNQSYEFVDIEFITPNYIDSYLACTSFLFRLPAKDRQRVIKHKDLLNSFQRNLSRFLDDDRSLFYSLCIKDFSCKVRFPYSLLEPQILFWQLRNRKPSISSFHERKVTGPTPISFLDRKEDIEFWKLPKVDFIKEFWDVTKSSTPTKISLSSMTYSTEFLYELSRRFKDKNTPITIFASFNMMVLEEEITKTIRNLPPNILFIPIFQTPEEPYSFHQKGAIIFYKQNSKFIWTSSNFRRYETNKLIDLGMTLNSAIISQSIEDRWNQTALDSCNNTESIDFNLRLRFYNFPGEYVFWKELVKRNCNKLTASPRSPVFTKPLLKVVLDMIKNAKFSIDVHTHILGNSEILQRLIEMERGGIKVRIVGGKMTRFNLEKPWIRYIRSDPQHHAKFILIDNSFFVWGTGNFTKTSLSNQREDFFIGSHAQIINQLREYFDESWKIAK